MYERELTRVKEKLEERIQESEMTINSFYETTHELLKEEGINEGEYRRNSLGNAIKVGMKLMEIFPVKEYTGLNSEYIALENNELTNETKKDLEAYSQLEEKTLQHMRQKWGNTTVYMKQFFEELQSYLSQELGFNKDLVMGKYISATRNLAYKITQELDIRKDPPGEKELQSRELTSALNKI